MLVILGVRTMVMSFSSDTCALVVIDWLYAHYSCIHTPNNRINRTASFERGRNLFYVSDSVIS